MFSDCPLVKKYFGKYLRQLLQAHDTEGFIGRFVKYANYPYGLEARLQRVEYVGITQSVLDEVGNYTKPSELDDRLLDAWAELRLVDQLVQEGFSAIRKVNETADFAAFLNGQMYAFQVTRVKKPLLKRVKKHSDNLSPYGSWTDINKRFRKPTRLVFLRAINEKNIKFAAWKQGNCIRCIVLVSIDEALQDNLVRHFVCQGISQRMGELKVRNFEAVLWLPDLGNGALFQFQADGTVKCAADWQDDPGDPRYRQVKVSRWEVNLLSDTD